MSIRQTRSQARIEAFKLIFQMQVNNEDPDFLFENLLNEHPECKKNIDYIKTVVLGVLAKNDELTDIIQDNMGKNWRIERISKVSLAVLKLAIFEIQYIEDVPTKVAINEAVEIDKKFDDPDNSAFINGVLGGYVRKL